MSFLNFCRSIGYTVYVYIVGTLYLLQEWTSMHIAHDDLPKCEDEVLVVTGGGRGIGAEIVRKLLKTGRHVIIGCRNPSSVENVIREMKVTSGKFECLKLDLSSMSSVRSFAQEILAKKLPINVLINNAGIMFTPYTLTEDDFESQLAVNYIGHFLLTHLLLPLLKDAGTAEKPSRVVNVSSSAHWAGNIFFHDINMTTYYSPVAAYGQSKLAQILFSNYLNAKLKSENLNVCVNSVHPGIVHTDLYEHTAWNYVSFLMKYIFKSPSQGADSVLYPAVCEETRGIGGKFYNNSHEGSYQAIADDLVAQETLFRMTCDILNIKEFGQQE